MINPWRSEIYWVTWLAFVALFLGYLTGHFFLAPWLACLVYLGRHLYHINKLLLWLRTGGKPPAGGGIWEEINYLIYRLRRRNKRRKKRLIEMLERFRTATSALPDATVVLGPRDDIEWFNDAAGQLLGLRRNDVGQQIVNLLRSPRFAQFLKECDYDKTVTVPSPHAESRQLEIRIVQYGEGLRLLVARDITQVRMMEHVRRDFVANVSHELRTPLTVLKGYLETLTDETSLSDRHRMAFKRMEEQTVRMQNLVDGLLSLSRLESGAPAAQMEVDVGALLEAIVAETALLQAPHPALRLDLATEANLLGAKAELHSAFSNIIVNALKYTQPEGQVSIRWYDADGGACLDVEDNGPGIAAEHISRLTERFYRVEKQGTAPVAGAGLGLAIVKHVLSRHDAKLTIRSKPGAGSCFSCEFPARRVIRASIAGTV
jgi:two-component system phosphate regulon sensor histidine kinase PhoR